MDTATFQLVTIVVQAVFIAVGALVLWILSDLRARVVRLENNLIIQPVVVVKPGQSIIPREGM